MSMAHTQTKDPANHRSTYNYSSPVEDLASFLIVRGPHAWYAHHQCSPLTLLRCLEALSRLARWKRQSIHRLGAGWAGCDCYPPFYAGFEADYGTPVKDYAETAAGSGVFAREWTKADVSFDCNVGKANITMK